MHSQYAHTHTQTIGRVERATNFVAVTAATYVTTYIATSLRTRLSAMLAYFPAVEVVVVVAAAAVVMIVEMTMAGAHRPGSGIRREKKFQILKA